jgi:hypothetical protein
MAALIDDNASLSELWLERGVRIKHDVREAVAECPCEVRIPRLFITWLRDVDNFHRDPPQRREQAFVCAISEAALPGC